MELDLDKAKERLASPSNLANRIRAFRNAEKNNLEDGVLRITKGKKLPRLPDEAKEEIKEKLATGLVKGQDLAREYGVADCAITRIKKELREETLSARASVPTLSEDLDNALTPRTLAEDQIKDLAIQKMMCAMGLITEEKLEKLKVKGLASIATAMAKVIGTVAPKPTNAPLVNLVVYSPEVREEKSYKIVEIGSEKAS